MQSGAEQDPAALRAMLSGWARAWNLAGLETRLEVRFSRRFRTSLGRCVPARGEIRLAAFLLEGPPELLRETLCHEAAHAAAYELHGRSVRPHGREWRALMQAAGFEPRARVPASALPGPPRTARRTGKVWQHRCPVCRASRLARRRVPRWRCAACRAAGLAGKLLVAPVGWR